MQELIELLENRQSARGPFDPERGIPAEEMAKILEAARWTPTAHNMQNFEIVVVDDKQLLAAISEIKVPVEPVLIRRSIPNCLSLKRNCAAERLGSWAPGSRSPGKHPILTWKRFRRKERAHSWPGRSFRVGSSFRALRSEPPGAGLGGRLPGHHQSRLRHGKHVADGQLARHRRPYPELVVHKTSGGGDCEAAQRPG